MKFLGIIPARYQSTRFPGKPLVKLGDRTILERVYRGCEEVVDDLYVATDHEGIFNHVKQFGGNVVMTSPEHRSGTDRCGEAVESVISGTGTDPDVIINIQGDEPFVKKEQLLLLKDCFTDQSTEIATLAKRIEQQEDIFDQNTPKVVFNKENFAMYFSRSPIPFLRGKKENEWLYSPVFYRHLGIYAFRKEVLRKISRLGVTDLESAESLEQLRWLENGYKIKVAVTSYDSVGIDTPADLKRAERFMARNNLL